MKSGLPLRLVVFCIVVLSLTACSKRDKTISVEEDDVEMTAAIAKARATLPHFWQVFEKPEHGETDFALKVRVTDTHGTEHFWANEIKRQPGKIMGTINNDPNIVKSVKLGSRIEIPVADISDWLYLRGDKMIGNHTLQPLFKQMPEAEVKRLKSIMADP
jgi:uncharacterized protein YegJ (DUF2314 family)